MPNVSVVIVSRGRPHALTRCLISLWRQLYFPFEAIVVADAPGCAAARSTHFSDYLKIFHFDRANISAARNLGISQAAGEIVAFIDDDSVAEPTWLSHLVAGLKDADAVGGYVRGRNGISFQHQARIVGPAGFARPWSGEQIPPGWAIKTEGTNMAVRREVLRDVGGFDEGFAFYLDETDLNLRLARQGYKTQLCPMAQVHHGYSPSIRRRLDRAPTSLLDIGASAQLFWNKHLPISQHSLAQEALLAERHHGLAGYLNDGRLEPHEISRLMQTLRQGLKSPGSEGYADWDSHTPAQPFQKIRKSEFFPLSTWVGLRVDRLTELHAKMDQRNMDNSIFSVVLLTTTIKPHRVRMDENGVWWQTGGIWGRSIRSERINFWLKPMERFIAEIDRVRGIREYAKPRIVSFL